MTDDDYKSEFFDDGLKIISDESVTCTFTYPLSKEVTTIFTNENGFTFKDIVDSICKYYQYLYENDNNTAYWNTLNDVHPTYEGITGLDNIEKTVVQYFENDGSLPESYSSTSNGEYGIWGYLLCELYITYISYDHVSNHITLNIDGNKE